MVVVSDDDRTIMDPFQQELGSFVNRCVSRITILAAIDRPADNGMPCSTRRNQGLWRDVPFRRSKKASLKLGRHLNYIVATINFIDDLLDVESVTGNVRVGMVSDLMPSFNDFSK